MEKYSNDNHIPEHQRPGGDSNPTHDNMVTEAKVFYSAEAGIFKGEYAHSHSRGEGQMKGEREE